MSDDAVTTKGGRRIDLDAARKARLEKKGEPPVVLFNGKSYVLPLELPADAVTSIGMLSRGDMGALDGVLEGMFGGQLEAIKADAAAAGSPLSYDDLVFLIEHVVEEYGITLPGSSASADS